MRALLLGGILPVVAFTVVEEYYGTLWGVIVGMIFGVGEMLSEWIRFRKIETMTWIGNALLIGMGGISLFTGEGIWMKLQPAIIEAAMALVFVGSVVLGKPILVMLAEKQGTFATLPDSLRSLMMKAFVGLTLRISFFLWSHAFLATYAAFYWTTREWAILKGVGFTGSFIIYMLIEVFFLRREIKKSRPAPSQSGETPPGIKKP